MTAQGKMSRRTRLVLAILGLLFVALALILLAYALWPLDSALQRVPLPPDAFREPGAWLPPEGGVV